MAPERNAPEPAPTRASRARGNQQEAPADKPVGRKRNPMMMALALMLISLSALGGVWLATRGQETVGVIKVTRDVPVGQTITAEDVAVVQMPRDGVDMGLATVGGSRLSEVVGSVAVRPLYADTNLTESAYRATLGVPEGRRVIAVTLEPDRVPNIALAHGQTLVLVETPASSTDLVSIDGPWEATFISRAEVGNRSVLTVHVDEADAGKIQSRAWVNRISVGISAEPGAPVEFGGEPATAGDADGTEDGTGTDGTDGGTDTGTEGSGSGTDTDTTGSTGTDSTDTDGDPTEEPEN